LENLICGKIENDKIHLLSKVTIDRMIKINNENVDGYIVFHGGLNKVARLLVKTLNINIDEKVQVKLDN
jgi:hypothetical protein